jgi:hypothetical protein
LSQIFFICGKFDWKTDKPVKPDKRHFFFGIPGCKPIISGGCATCGFGFFVLFWSKLHTITFFIAAFSPLNQNHKLIHIMLAKDLSKYTISHIEKGFETLKSENDARLKPLKELMSSGKKLTDAEERFIDQAANLVDEWKVVERIREVGDVARAAIDLNKEEKAALEVLILKADQPRPVMSKALNSELCIVTNQSSLSQMNNVR